MARKGEEKQKLQAQSALNVADAEKQRADVQARKGTESQKQSRRLLYDSEINLAQQALNANNLGRARQLLNRQKPQPGEEDLRGWEWRYLWQLTRSGALVTLTNRNVDAISVSFSPDGKVLAAGWSQGQVDLWDVPSRRCIRTLTESGKAPHACVAFSPVRNLLAATSPQAGVALYDLDASRDSLLWRAPAGKRWQIHKLSFSSDGSRLIISASRSIEVPGDDVWTPGDAVWVANVSSAKIEFEHATGNRGPWFGGAAQLSPDNQRLYLEHCDDPDGRYRIQCLDLATGRELWQTPPQPDGSVSALALSADGRLLASGSAYEDPTIRVWDSGTGTLLKAIGGHTGWVSELAVSKDGRRLISASSDQTIRFWETDHWIQTQLLRGHPVGLTTLALSDSAQLVASADMEGNLLLWKADGNSAEEGCRLLSEISKGDRLWMSDRSRLLVGPPGKPPKWVDLNPNSTPDSVPDLAFATDVFGCFGTNSLCRWDGTNRIVVHDLEGSRFIQRGAVEVSSATRPIAVAYNPARKLLAWVEDGASDSVQVASLAAPDRRFKLKSIYPGAVGIAFGEAGDYLVAMTEGSSALVWNVESGQIVASEPKLGIVNSWSFAAGGRMLALARLTPPNAEVVFYDFTHANQAPRRVALKDPPVEWPFPQMAD
jgi:WD40 repeat protein